mgnify:CR=1 FL=1
MSETEAESEAQNVQMSLVDTVNGLPADGGYRLAATQALEQAGYSRSDAERGIQGVVKLSQPDDGTQALTGAVVTGDDDEPFAYDTDQRMILRTGGSLAVVVTKEMLDEIGVDYSEDDRPLVDIWAAEGVIALTPIETRVIHVDTEFDPVRALPDVLEQDYRAVVEEGMDPSEWAERRGLTPLEEENSSSYKPEYYINQNVRKAKELIEKFEKFENQKN